MTAKMTLVMPCYNAMKYIGQAIDSVLMQSMTDWELIISDNASTDGTGDFLRSLKDPRIKVHFQPVNKGVYGNINFLFSVASAPLTQILCHDDYLLGTDALQRILDIWAGLPEEVAFLRCSHGHDASYGLVRLEQRVLPQIIEPKDSVLFFFVFGCIPGSLSNVSVRTQVVEQMGWYRADLSFMGDFEFWRRTGRARPWALSTVHVVHVRRHAEQATFTLNRKGEMLPQQYLLLQEMYRELRERGYRPMDLRLTATVMYAVRNLDRGLKDIFTGMGWHYLVTVNRLFVGTEGFLGVLPTWLIYGATAGGRLFAPTVAKHLLSIRPRN